MRPQYHARRVGPDKHVWDVLRLVRLAKDLPRRRIPLSAIAELDENWWYPEPWDTPTPRAFVDHMKLVATADLAYPILLCAEGRLMDGMHRACRALLDGHPDILAQQFETTPAPDFVNVELKDL